MLRLEKKPRTFSHSLGKSMRFTFERKISGMKKNSSIAVMPMSWCSVFLPPLFHVSQVYLCR